MKPRRLAWFLVLTCLLVGALFLRPWIRPARFLVLASKQQGLLGRWAHWGSRPLKPIQQIQRGGLTLGILEPRQEAERTFLLCSGVHSSGIQEPRLLSFAAALASCGYRVILMAPPDLTRFRLTPACTTAIESAAIHLVQDRTLCPKGRLGIIGISFSGGLALIAASHPDLNQGLDFVVSIGGHADIQQVLTYLSTGVASPVNGSIAPKPHDYGAAVSLLNLASKMVPKEQVPGLEKGILTFLEAIALDSTDRKAAALHFQRAREMEGALPEPSRSLLGKINQRDMQGLGSALKPFLATLAPDPRLSPLHATPPPTRIFLLHGLQDSVVPASESQQLATRWKLKAPSGLLITPLLGHTETQVKGQFVATFQLLRFWEGILSNRD